MVASSAVVGKIQGLALQGELKKAGGAAPLTTSRNSGGGRQLRSTSSATRGTLSGSLSRTGSRSIRAASAGRFPEVLP